jgi:hypothetical protein
MPPSSSQHELAAIQYVQKANIWHANRPVPSDVPMANATRNACQYVRCYCITGYKDDFPTQVKW